MGAKTKVPGAGLLASARRRVVVFRSRRAAGALVLGLAGERPGPVVVWGAGREVRRGGKKVGAGPKAGAGAGAGARKKVGCAGGGAAAGKTGVEGCDGQHGGQRSGADQRRAEHGRATMKSGGGNIQPRSASQSISSTAIAVAVAMTAAAAFPDPGGVM